VGIFEKLLLKKPTKVEFAKHVLNALEKAGVVGSQYDVEKSSIRVESRNATFYLDNAFASYLAAEKAQRSGVIQRYVSAFLQTASIPKDFATARASLLPIVKDPAYFSLSLLMLKADGQDTSKLDNVTKRIAEGLVATIACDTEHTIMTVDRSTLEEWRVTLEEALEVATINLRDRSNPEGMKEIVPGLFVSQWGDSYDSARILIPDILHRLSLNGDPVIFVPNRDQLWVTGKYNNEGIRAMLTHGKQSHFEQGHTLSPNLYTHSSGRWEFYAPEEEELKKLGLSMKKQREGIDYAQQKGYLEKLYKREKNDVFVATCQVLKRQDEALFSRCVWTNGVDSLLPETDVIVFLPDPKEKVFITVSWNGATSIVGFLMEMEPELTPPRYRVRHFPDAEQLVRLRQVAME
jgi:uncharacterized protein YtpQ (UPF0354 family)